MSAGRKAAAELENSQKRIIVGSKLSNDSMQKLINLEKDAKKADEALGVSQLTDSNIVQKDINRNELNSGQIVV